jgi:hypothetical protein
MRVVFDMTVEDLDALEQLVLPREQLQQSRRSIYRGGLRLAMAPLGLIVMLLFSGGAPGQLYFMVAVPAILVAVLWTIVFRSSVAPRMASVPLRESNVHLVGAHVLDVTREGIGDVGPAGESFHKWAVVQRIHDEPTHVFVQIAGGLYYTIPKRALASPEALLDELREHGAGPANARSAG